MSCSFRAMAHWFGLLSRKNLLPAFKHVSRIIKLWHSFSVRYRLTAVTSTQRPSLRPLILPVFRMNVVSCSYVNILSKTSRLLASCLCFVGCFFSYHCLSNSEFKRCYFFITCLPLCFVVLSRLCCIPN